MPRKISFPYGVINITIHPHSPQKYLELFNEAFSPRPPVKQKYRGDEFISVSLYEIEGLEMPTPEFRGIVGYINKFNRVSGDWYDGNQGERANEEDKPGIDTERFFSNHIMFPFVFLSQGHRLFFISSQEGKKLSGAYLAKSLEKLLNTQELIEKYGNVSVNVEMSSVGIEAMLGMDRLDKLLIKVTLPNGDDLEEEEEEWRQRLEEQNVARINENIAAPRNSNLKPDVRTKALMRLAQSNGSITAQGLEHGEKKILKSSEFPMEYQGDYIEGDSIFKALGKCALEKISLFTNHVFSNSNENHE